ncbi:MAG: LLM class flavin-dependent oxidoreductase [Planctomycetes bacterium]|nr:LLM class flavin-dependent oxidoreductase [Planctomycetota bacterium]
MQQGMLYHHLSQGHRGVDIEQIVCTLEEKLDTAAFQAAWRAIVARHGNFRVAFRWSGLDEPVQEVFDEVELPWEELDWSDADAGDRERRLEAYIADARRGGFDLTRAPVARVALIRFGAASFRCVWTFHHIIMDGRSFPLVLEDLFRHYDAIRRSEALPGDLPKRYAEYIDWWRGREFRGAESFWRQLLRGFKHATPLPAARDAAQEGAAQARGSSELRLPRALSERLHAFAKEQGLTLNTLVQGAWALLLARYSGEDDVIFGATRACRNSTIPGADRMVGVFINTLPVRVRIPPEAEVRAWLRDLRDQQIAVRPHENTPLVQVMGWAEVPHGTPLFETLFVYDHAELGTAMRAPGGAWSARDFVLREHTGFPLTLYGYGERELLLRIAFDTPRFSEDAVQRLLQHLAAALGAFVEDPARRLRSVSLLTGDESRQVLEQWNATAADYPRGECVHEGFEAQAARTPAAVALTCRDQSLSYEELNRRANRLAHHLRSIGVGPEVVAGIQLERSLDMVVAVLAVLKAGGAYLPLDPLYPRERLAFMLEDSGARVLITQESLRGSLDEYRGTIVYVDDSQTRSILDACPAQNPAPSARPQSLAYLIYTSGSTGRPKGVMVEHRNVVNFLWAMDARIGEGERAAPRDEAGVWLSVTSLSFDISVLEIFWTLARGFHVVLYAEGVDRRATRAPVTRHPERTIEFSLFYFASAEDQDAGAEKYRLLVEGAKFADRHGFHAVWTPERHFHAFGGLYPNPSVTAGIVAALTERVRIRAGSVVAPLHHPLRIAEEWALVDNVSRGRVGISFASGWQPNDFVLAPERYENRRTELYSQIEQVQRLWRGEAMTLKNAKGDDVAVRTLPRPIQKELPTWITTAGNVDTYRKAGEIGANVLTHLLGQTVEDLAEKIRAYRDSFAAAGHGAGGSAGVVTLMLHTYVGSNDEEVREAVREPMKRYLATSLSLIQDFVSSWTAFRRSRGEQVPENKIDLSGLNAEDRDALLEYSFSRYYETSGLFGTPERCIEMVDRLKEIGVDEIACLIDFGVESEQVLASLRHLDELRANANARRPAEDEEKYGVAPSLGRHAVTHLQCTPSMATMLLRDKAASAALAPLRKIFIGGEAFPPALARELRAVTHAALYNMYGPTETTVWSAVGLVAVDDGTVPIPRPIANTKFYLLDAAGSPVPIGVAGELYIGGDGVARGYHQRPELTAERFLPNPFDAGTSGRIYRTGDLMRYRSDGTLDFLGRVDHQVKIRGHRIELGEIESRMREIAGIDEAVVVAREDAPGDQRLVGYYCLRAGAFADEESVLAELRAHLPEIMVPWRAIALEAMPRTPNGKIDRRALPAPSALESPAARAAPEPPASEIERTLAGIWQEVLGLAEVGVRDNFFDLGGHSLLTIRVQGRIEERLGRRLPITDLFRFPTVRSLAQHLAAPAAEDRETLRASEGRAEARRQALAARSRLRPSRKGP